MSDLHTLRRATAWLVIGSTMMMGCKGAGPSWLARWKQPAQQRLSDPAEPPLNARQKADVQMSIARSLEQEGRTAEAMCVYQELLNKNKYRPFRPGIDRAEAYYRLALLHDRKSEYDKAEVFYRHALQLASKNAEVYCDLGYNCYLRHRWDDAESNLRRAIVLQPELQRAHNNLGLVLTRTNRLDEAHAEFILAGCSPADAQSNLAFALLIDEKLDLAQEQFERLRVSDPSLKTAQDGLATLQTIAAKSDASRKLLAPEQNQLIGDTPPSLAAQSTPVSASYQVRR